MSLLLFAEDPGAVNYIAPLFLALQAEGVSVHLFSSGIASSLLSKKGLFSQEIVSGNEAAEILLVMMPRLLIVGTSENLDSPGLTLLSEAKKVQIKSIGVIDGAANAAFRFRGKTDNALAFAPDLLILPDEWTAEEYKAIGFAESQIFVAGHPHDDYLTHMKEIFNQAGYDNLRRLIFPSVKTGQLIVVFASELSTGLNEQQFQKNNEYTLFGRGYAVSRTEIVIEELIDAVEFLSNEGIPRPYLVLRRHPKESSTRLADYIESFNWVSDNEDALSLIYAADIVVGMSSMLLYEAYVLGTLVMSILPRENERNWLSLTRSNAIPCATRSEMVRQNLRELLMTSSWEDKRNVYAPLLGVTFRIISFLRANNMINEIS